MAQSCRFQPPGWFCAVSRSWHGLHKPRPYCGSFGSSPSSISSLRDLGWWSAMVLGAMWQSTQIGSVCRTCGRKYLVWPLDE